MGVCGKTKKDIVYIHLPTIKKITNKYTGAKYVEYWTKWIYLDIPSEVYKSVQYERINCTERLLSVFDTTDYNLKGEITKSYNVNLINSRIIPDSIAEAEYDFVCK